MIALIMASQICVHPKTRLFVYSTKSTHRNDIGGRRGFRWIPHGLEKKNLWHGRGLFLDSLDLSLYFIGIRCPSFDDDDLFWLVAITPLEPPCSIPFSTPHPIQLLYTDARAATEKNRANHGAQEDPRGGAGG